LNANRDVMRVPAKSRRQVSPRASAVNSTVTGTSRMLPGRPPIRAHNRASGLRPRSTLAMPA
jgi:hypothetical protein